MTITAASYPARVSGECILGTSKSKGTPFIEFYLTILSGPNQGGKVRWTGYFTPNTNERTIQSLQTCGWRGDDPAEFSDGQLHGLDANEVEIVVELEEYQTESGETRTSPRVAWINRASGFLNKSSAMSEAAAVKFGESMRGLVMKLKEKLPPASPSTAPPASPPLERRLRETEDDGIPF